MREFALMYLWVSLGFWAIKAVVTNDPSIPEASWFQLALGAGFALVYVGDRR